MKIDKKYSGLGFAIFIHELTEGDRVQNGSEKDFWTRKSKGHSLGNINAAKSLNAYAVKGNFQMGERDPKEVWIDIITKTGNRFYQQTVWLDFEKPKGGDSATKLTEVTVGAKESINKAEANKIKKSAEEVH